MVAERLAQLVLRYPDALQDERACRANLEDLLQADPARRMALWSALVSGTVAKLRAPAADERDAATLVRLALELEAVSGLRQELALWAVQTWARALELVGQGGQGRTRGRRPKNWVIAPFSTEKVNRPPDSVEPAVELPPPVELGEGPFFNPFVEPPRETNDRAARNQGFFKRAVEECFSGSGVNPFRLERLLDLQRRLEVDRETAAVVFEAVAREAKPRRGRKVAELVVSRTGHGDYTTIGEALANAKPGARVWVRPGLYEESLHLDRPVELIAEGARGDVRVLARDEHCVHMDTSFARVCGFSLGNHGAGAYAAVWAPAGQLALDDCEVTSGCGHGLAAVGPEARPGAFFCVFRNCRSAGAHASNHARPEFVDCVFMHNAGGGVTIERHAGPKLEHCLLLENHEFGASVSDDGYGLFSGCRFFQHEQEGLRTRSGGTPIVSRCVFQENRRCGAFAARGGLGTLSECVFLRNGATLTADLIGMHGGAFAVIQVEK
jgi:hypothetical protein